MIKNTVYVRGSPSFSWGGSSETKQGSSSLFGLGGSLFCIPPIGSSEELWFLVVLDTASPLLPSCTSAAVILSIVSLKSSTTSACNGASHCPAWLMVKISFQWNTCRAHPGSFPLMHSPPSCTGMKPIPCQCIKTLSFHWHSFICSISAWAANNPSPVTSPLYVQVGHILVVHSYTY